MFQYSGTGTRIALLLLAGFVPLTQTGCQKTPEAPPKAAPVLLPTRPDKTELAEKGSGLYSRTIVYGGNDGQTVTELRLIYENGDRGVIRFRPEDGTLAETEERYADSNKLRSQSKYSSDGKLLVTGKLWRPDGTLRLVAEREADGFLRFDRYWFDGSYICLSKKEQGGEAGILTVFWKQGKSRLVEMGWREKGRSILMQGWRRHGWTSFFQDNANALSRKIVFNPTGYDVYWYTADGRTATHKQTYRYPSGTFAGGITEVEEFESDGKTTRRRIHIDCLEPLVYKITKVEKFASGKPEVVRHLVQHKDSEPDVVIQTLDVPGVAGTYSLYLKLGTVGRDETLDAQGNITATKSYSADDNEREPIGVELLQQPHASSAQNKYVQELYRRWRGELNSLPPAVKSDLLNIDRCRWYSDFEWR